jgi:hypothetical protein
MEMADRVAVDRYSKSCGRKTRGYRLPAKHVISICHGHASIHERTKRKGQVRWPDLQLPFGSGGSISRPRTRFSRPTWRTKPARNKTGADLTDAKSVLQELQAVVPTNPSVPVQPVILAAQEEPGMLDFFRPFPWVLKTHCYHTPEHLIDDLDEQLIGPAEAKVLELRWAKLSRRSGP